MKTKLLLPIIVLCCLSFHLSAQEKQPDTFKHDIGFNTYFILRGLFESDPTPLSLMYKRYSSETKATRLGATVSVGVSNSKGDAQVPSNYSNSSTVSMTLSIGKEFQKDLSQKWIWYYGGDLLPAFSSYKTEAYNNNQKSRETTDFNVGLSARPFLGIRFNLHPRLYLSAEASASLSYIFSKNVVKTINPNEVQYNQDITRNFLSLSLSPASGLFLFYRF